MSLRSTANFCRRFGIGFKAGVDFLRLIDSEAKHGTARQRAIMSDVHQSVRTGSQLHVAMMEHANYFPALLIAMTRAGEITGTLDRTLLALANYYDERIRLYREFISRITWPMLQLFIAVNILALLIWLMGALRPAGGGEMMDILGFGLRGSSGALTLYGYVICFGLIVAAMIVGFQKNIAGVQNLIPILYKVPVIGEALQTITLARFCWTLALALDAGIDPIRAMHMACDATDSDYYRSAKDDIEKSIHSGNNISGSMQVAGVFPDEFINEVSVAEMSGTDAEAMHHLAAQYDTRARSAMQTLARVASGIIALSVACALIFVILRMIMNIYGPGGVYSEALKPI
jgi:type II secretory pathway component PulF